MKLHLPTSLRKALLACLAALVVPSFTMASGSALFGAALFSYLAATPVALADNVYITRGSADASGDPIEDPAEARRQMELFYYHEYSGPDLNTSEHTWIFDQDYSGSDQFYFGGGDGKEGDLRSWTINANIRLDADLHIGNGYSDRTQTFNGNFSGTGDMWMDWTGGSGQTWAFTGDLSEWSGNLLSFNAASFTVRFSNSTSSNTGGISLIHYLTDNTSRLEISDSVMNNAYITVDGTLLITGACTFNVGDIDVAVIQFTDNVSEEGNDTVVTFAGQDGRGSVSFDSMAAQWKANVTFAEGVDFTMNGDLQLSTVHTGAVTRTYDFGGQVSLQNLTVYGGNGVQNTAHVIFRKGARIEGNLTTGWGSLIELGDDLEFTGSLTVDSGTSSTITLLAGAQEGTVGILFYTGTPGDDEETQEVEMTLDEYNGKYSGNFTNLMRGKSGSNTLKFTDGGTINYSFKVKEGSVLFTADTTIAGWVSGAGTLEVGSGATLTLSDGGSFGSIGGEGIFSVTQNTTLTEGGSVGVLDFASNCTLTLGAELTVGNLTGTGTINYGGKEGGSTKLIISNQDQGNSTPRVSNFQFGENVNLEIDVNNWATFIGGSLNDVLITAGELDLQGVTVNGDVTMGSSGKRQLTIQVYETTFTGNVSIDTFVLRSGATATVQGNLSVAQGLEDDNQSNTITVSKNLTLSPGQNVSKTYSGTLTVTGLFTKNGVGAQTLGGTVTLNGGLLMNAGSLTLSGTSNVTDTVTTKSGLLTFSGTTNMTGGVNLQGGTLRFDGAASTEFTLGGTLTVADDATFEQGSGWLKLVDGSVFNGTLNILASEENVSRSAKLSSDSTNKNGDLTIKSLVVGTGATLTFDHGGSYKDAISIQEAFRVGGTVKVNGTELTLEKGGSLQSGGNLTMDWGGRLILNEDFVLDSDANGLVIGRVNPKYHSTTYNIMRKEGVTDTIYLSRAFNVVNEAGGGHQDNRMAWTTFLDKFLSWDGGVAWQDPSAPGQDVDVFDRVGEGIGLSVSVSGAENSTLFVDFSGGNVTFGKEIRIASGSLAFSNPTNNSILTLTGKITGEGNLFIWTEKFTPDNDLPAVVLSGGGSISGKLLMSYWGGHLTLGSDFEAGGLATGNNHGGVGNAAPFGGRYYYIDSTGDVQRTLTLNVADGDADIDVDINTVTITGNILLHKIGEGTQRILNATFGDDVDISIEEGKLILSLADGSKSISGNVSITGSGVLEFDGNTGLSGASIGGNLTWDKDVDENLGILGVSGTLTVGSLVEDEDNGQVSRAGTHTLSVGTYGNDHYIQNNQSRFPLHDVVIQSGTLDISLNANGWEGDTRDDRNVLFGIGSITGQGEGATLRVTRASYSNYTNFWAVLLIDGQEDDVFQGTLEFKDAVGNSATGKVEVQIAKNWTLGSIDVTHGAGAVTIGANGLTLNVLREITGEQDGDTAYQLNFLSGTSNSGRTEHSGTVNLQAGGAIAGLLNLGSTIALNIGNGKTLSVGGLSGNGSAGLGIWTADGANTGSATIEITGTRGIFQNYDLTDFTLVLKSGARQTLDGDANGTQAKVGLVQLENNASLSYRTNDNMIRRIAQLNDGAGSLHVFNTRNLTIGEGSIGGDLQIGQGSRIFLNGDLTIGGLTAATDNTSASFIKILENTGEAAWTKFYGEFDQHATEVTLTLDVDGKYTGSTAKEYQYLPQSSGTITQMNIGSDKNARNAAFTLKKTGAGEQKFAGVNISADVVLNAGRLTFINRTEGETPMSTIWGDVRLGEGGSGTLAIVGAQVTLSALSAEAAQNKSTIGTLEVQSGGSVTLDRDLTVSDLIVDNNSENAFTHTGDTPTTLTLNVTTNNAGPNMNAATGAAGDWSLSLTGVKLEKTGSATYTIRGLVTDSLVDVQQGSLVLGNSNLADVNIESGATLVARHAGANTDTTNKNVISGELTGSGTLQVNSRTLEMTKAKGSGSFEKHGFTGILDMNWGGDLKLAADMQVGGLVSTQGQNSIDMPSTSVISSLNGDEITFTLHVAEGSKDFAYSNRGYLILESGVSLVKSGDGTQVLHDFGARELVTVSGGKLELAAGLWDTGTVDWTGAGATSNASPFFVNSILVDGAELSISKTNWYGAKDDEGAGTTVTLANGGTLSMAAVTSAETLIELGTLALSATNAGDTAGKFVWSTGTTTNATEVVNIYKLTGTGSLILDAAGTAADATKGIKILDLKSIVDYTGAISYSGAAWSSDSALRVGTVNQSAEAHQASITGIDVYSSAFRKLGAGSLTIEQDLYIDSYGAGGAGSIWMNYQGTLTINGELHIAGGSDLVYTLAEQGQVIEWAAADLVSSGGVTVNVRDIIDRDASLLSQDHGGIDLGITGGDAYSLDQLAALISLSGQVDGAQIELRLDEESGHVYLIISEFELGNVPWDTKWGVENASSTTPTIGQMDTWALSKAPSNAVDGILSANGGEFSSAALTLDGTLFAGTEDTGRIKLDKGGASGTAASIIGGWLIDGQEDVVNGNQSRSVYIQLAPTADATAAGQDNYHLLVGGSAVVYSGAVSAGSRRFSGNTHIQMEGGKVDYIVGGNHVTNIAYGFTGNSFISVMGDSTVRGGIVGGSTLTKGAAKNDDPNARDAIEFDGNSHIYIHTVLSYQGATPSITTGTAGDHQSFNAVVGGNAWIELADTSAASNDPLFRGSSRIDIDLNDGEDTWGSVKTGSFDLAIVGGNYTAAFDGDSTQERSSRFRKYGKQEFGSTVTINATDDVTFTAGVNGASRRASSGSGQTYFEGNTLVEINGGRYTDIVAGGFWFDPEASGSHSSLLEGHTNVRISDGTLWRVVGGSVSLGGTSSSSTDEGDAYVSIAGGHFANKAGTGANGALTQGDIGFVTGGDFYKNTGTADGHVRNGNTTLSITGGVFNDMHIVGGDYANFSGSTGDSGPVINGTSSVFIGGEDSSAVSITGLVVGGSYMTDEAGQGQMTIKGIATDESGKKLATHIVIGENANLSKDSGSTGHSHSRVAIVAGHVVMDYSSSGAHTASIVGDTWIEVTGGSVTGDIVGGSYAGASSGVNLLSITEGDSRIDLTGGVVSGSIVGGHYSENTDSPDTLVLGDVTITLDGAEVNNGNIIGGSHRSATTAADTAPSQGNITINLLSGKLSGSVYAAGEHVSTTLDSALHETTQSTLVKVSESVIFGAESIISGGYLKNAPAMDSSTVQNDASLVIEGNGSNLSGVSFVDFDHVDTAADVVVSGSMTVMDRAANTGFVKTGAGRLTLKKGLLGAAGDYTGKLALAGGALSLGADLNLSKLSELEIDLTGRYANSAATAWLAADGAASLLVDIAEGPTDVRFTNASGKLEMGTYYLTGELSGLGIQGVEAFFNNLSAADLLSWVDEGVNVNLEIKEGCLTLRVHNSNPDEWYWEGGHSDETQIWDDTGKNWSRDNNASLEAEMADVHFNSGAANGNVGIKDSVSPGNVYIESGNFTFTQAEGEGGLDIGNGSAQTGVLYVGVGVNENNYAPDAALDLQLDNYKVPAVQINQGGTLTLSSERAIQTGSGANNNTQIDFNGGLLVYGEAADGSLAFSADVSSQVTAAAGSLSARAGDDWNPQYNNGGLIRVQIGNSVEVSPMSARAAEGNTPTVVWDEASSNGAANNGINRIFNAGIEKSGRGDFIVRWATEASKEYKGFTIRALEGKLVFEVSPAARANTISLASNQAIEVAENAAVQFIAKQGIMNIWRSFEGDGKVIIGGDSELESNTSYVILGDNENFNGAIELVGKSNGTFVGFTDAASPQSETPRPFNGRQLILSGRGFRVNSGSNLFTVNMDVEVTEGTKNQVQHYHMVSGDYRFTDMILAGKLTGSGTLDDGMSEVAGTPSLEHRITGDMTEFTGTLFTSTANSKWNLGNGTADAPDTVQANYDGKGRIIFEYADTSSTRLTGQFLNDVQLMHNTHGTLVLAAGASKMNYSRGLITLTHEDSILHLGDADSAGTWAGGSVTGAGTMVLVNGRLLGGINTAGATLTVETSDIRATSVDAGGTKGDRFSAITVNAGGHLSGVSGTINASDDRQVKLVLDGHNIGAQSGTKASDFLIEMKGGGSMIIDKNISGFTIDFTSYGLIETLLMMRDAEANGNDGQAYLHLLTGGSLIFQQELENILELMAEDAPSGYTGLLSALGFKLTPYQTNVGEMILTGSSKDVYLVLGEDDAKSDEQHVTSDNKEGLEGKQATVIGPDATLDIELDGGDSTTVHNLVGVDGSTLHGRRKDGTEAGGEVTIELDNTTITGDIDGSGVDHANVSKEQARRQNTTFEGTMIGDEGVNFNKTGQGTLTVGRASDRKGGADIAGNLTLSQGGICFEGDRSELGEDSGNEIGALEFAYTDQAGEDEQRGFTFRNGTTTTHDIIETNDPAYDADNSIRLERNGKLIFAGTDVDGSTLNGTTFSSSDGTGTLEVQEGDLTLKGGDTNPRIDQVNVELSGGNLTLTDGATMKDGNLTVGEGSEMTVGTNAAVSGKTHVSITDGGNMTLADSAALDTTGQVEIQSGGNMTLERDAELHAKGGITVDGTLDLTTTQDSAINGLSGTGTISGNMAGLTLQGTDNSFGGTLDGSGTMKVNHSAALELNNVAGSGEGGWNVDNEGKLVIDVTKGTSSKLGEVHMGAASDTTIKVNTDRKGNGSFNLGGMSWDDGASLTIESTGVGSFVGDSLDLGTIGSLQEGNPDLHLKGTAFLHYEAGELQKDKNGRLKVLLTEIRDNLFRDSNMSKNELAGADMFWNASSPKSGNWRALTGDLDTALNSDLYRMVSSLTSMVQSGETEGMGRTLAAGAGASISVLGSALAEDVQRQLRAIRNRTTTMTPEPRYDSYDEMPFYHVWANGEGSYHKLKADGMAPGYSLNSWGGTLGADADLSRNTTVGVALTAMYGDLKADAADSAKGDMDTYYVSAFARVAEGSWLHTFVMTGGLADVSLDRTVNYGSGSYTTNGNTSGYSVAAMYEVGYAQTLNAEGSIILQSVANVTYRHSYLSGYTESGSDAGLSVNDISHDVVTLGAGARVQSAISHNAFNRTAIFEGRALVKTDIGDRSGKAVNQLINGDGTVRELESAKVGAVGLELGVGVTIPVGAVGGTIFMDASIEFRRGYTSMDANVGYRYNF